MSKRLYVSLRELAITMGFQEIEPDVFQKTKKREVIDIHTVNLKPLKMFAVPYKTT